MKLAEIPKKIVNGIVFGFAGLIVGIWTADLLYSLIFKNIDRVTTIYISLIIILLITFAASLIGFMKGRNLLDN